MNTEHIPTPTVIYRDGLAHHPIHVAAWAASPGKVHFSWLRHTDEAYRSPHLSALLAMQFHQWCGEHGHCPETDLAGSLAFMLATQGRGNLWATLKDARVEL